MEKEITDWKSIPIYKNSAAIARDKNELESYRNSSKANQACKKAIEQAIAEKWDGAHLPKDTILPIIEAYGTERTAFVLANTLQLKQYDERFSRENKAWAKNIQIESDPDAQPSERRYAWEINSHPFKLDMLVTQARTAIEEIGISEIPLYQETFEYATQNMEEGLYWHSYHCNIACAHDIQEAIADHYDGFRLESHAADDVLRKYGKDRTFFVLANTIHFMRDDGRVSLDNIRWADTFPLHKGNSVEEQNHKHFMVRGQHPGLFDLFVKSTRREQEQEKKPTLSEQIKRVKNAMQPQASIERKKERITGTIKWQNDKEISVSALELRQKNWR